MGLKDLALIKLIGGGVKKGKDKVTALLKSRPSDADESVVDTLSSALGKKVDENVEVKSSIKKEVPEKTSLKKETSISKSKTTVKKSTPSKKQTAKKIEKKEPVVKMTKKESVVTKENTVKKQVAKQTVIKSVPVKTTTTKKNSTAKPSKDTKSKKQQKIELYTNDIKKHLGSVDSAFLEIVVKNLGPSIYRKDAESVACTDKKELDTVRNNFLIKKLGFKEDEKEMLDLEIKKVCEGMKATKIKYRATFYYTLAKNLKKESKLS